MHRIIRLTLCLSLLLSLLTACSGAPLPETRIPETPPAATPTDPLDVALADANQATGESAVDARLTAIELLLARGDFARAMEQWRMLAPPDNAAENAFRYWAAAAQLAVKQGDRLSADAALTRLRMHPDARSPENARTVLGISADIALLTSDPRAAAEYALARFNLARSDQQRDDAWALFNILSRAEPADLTQLGESSIPGMQMWVAVNTLLRDLRLSPDQLNIKLDEWRLTHTRTSGFAAASALADQLRAQLSSPARVALLLPFDMRTASSTQAVIDGFLAEQYRAFARSESVPVIRVFDSAAADPRAVVREIAAFQPDCVIGPLLKTDLVRFASLLPTTTPVLALNFDPSVQGRANLLQFGLDPADEIPQLATWSHGRPRALMVTDESASSRELAITLREQWHNAGGEVLATLALGDLNAYRETLEQALHVDRSDARIRELERISGLRIEATVRARRDVDQLLMIASPTAARTIKPLLDFVYAGDIPIAALSSVFSGKVDTALDQDLNGIVFPGMPVFAPVEHALRSDLGDQHVASGSYYRLAALGADAWRLQHRLRLLQAFPAIGLLGATGSLRLNPQAKIDRTGTWYQFDEGIPTPL